MCLMIQVYKCLKLQRSTLLRLTEPDTELASLQDNAEWEIRPGRSLMPLPLDA